MSVSLHKDFNHIAYDMIIDSLARRENWTNCNVPNNLTIAFFDEDAKKITGGVILSLTAHCCYLTIYASDSRWCSRSNLANIFNVGFDFGSVVIKCATDFSNYKINKLLRGLGFRREGILRFARDNGNDEIVWSLSRREMQDQRWYKTRTKKNGQNS